MASLRDHGPALAFAPRQRGPETLAADRGNRPSGPPLASRTGAGEMKMKKTNGIGYTAALAGMTAMIAAGGAQAAGTLRIAMTASAVPTTTGMPNKGYEGMRLPRADERRVGEQGGSERRSRGW